MTLAKAISIAVQKSPIYFDFHLGKCTVGLSPWTLDFRSHALVAGNYHWILMSNMPLHLWNQDSIVAVLRPLFELIYVRKQEKSSLKHLRVLARFKKPIDFPTHIVIDVVVRSFIVLQEDLRINVLRQKIIQASSAPSSKINVASSGTNAYSLISHSRQLPCYTYQIMRETKGKAPTHRLHLLSRIWQAP